MPFDCKVVVIDNGSGYCKSGFAGKEFPDCVIPSIVGRPRRTVQQLMAQRNTYIGSQALYSAGILDLQYPIEKGIVTNWNDMEDIWKHIFNNELRIDSDETPVILTEPAINPRGKREKAIQIMFETFNVPFFYLARQSVLALYSHGVTTGVTFDSGDGASYIVPVYEGFYIPHAVNEMNISGRHLTNWLIDMLRSRGHYFMSSSEKQIARRIKEECCYVASEDTKYVEPKNYELPDGKMITLYEEQWKCPELLFNPTLNGFEMNGIDEMIFDSINRCDISIRQELYERIIITGGSTLFKGFKERLESDIIKRRNNYFKVKVIQNDNINSIWLGGSILGELDHFPQMAVTHDEYDEAGAGIVHRKCL